MATFHITCRGCDALQWDADTIRLSLLEHGHQFAANIDIAHTVIVMGCSFTSQHEQQFIKQVDTLAKKLTSEQRLYVSGCFIKQICQMPRVTYVRRDNLVQRVNQLEEDLGVLHSQRSKDHQPTTHCVAISEGCYGSCSFCSVRNIRGMHRSRPFDSILHDVYHVYKAFGHVRLVGQDIAAYGKDNGSTLWTLISSLWAIHPEIQLELGSLNPLWLAQEKDKELTILADSRILGNIHVPLQSASNAILSKMKRSYTREDFEDLWQRLIFIGVRHLSTDFIGGFPGETEQDHRYSEEFLLTHSLDFAQIFMFETRPGTEAVQLPQTPEPIRLRRTIDLIAQYISSYERFHGAKHYEVDDILNTNIDWKREVIADER